LATNLGAMFILINLTILQSYKPDSIPDAIIEIIGKEVNSLAGILALFLFNRESIDKLYKNEIAKLILRVQELSDDSNVNQLAIFVDNIDEAFDKYVGINKESVSENIWINAQLALLLVSNDLCSRNNHIKFPPWQVFQKSYTPRLVFSSTNRMN
jgi:hypothetical protein